MALGIFVFCVILASACCNPSNLEKRVSTLEQRFDAMETKFENIEKSIQSGNVALLKLISLLENVESAEKDGEEVRERREIVGNTEIGDITLKQIIDAHRSYGDKDISTGGSTYIRWGRKSCGKTAEQLYTGIAAGTDHLHQGGASNYQCLPISPEPEYNKISSSNTWGWIMGAEFETEAFNIFDKSIHNQNVPCARCHVPTRSSTIMIPARRTCPDSWTKEYEGYLMAGAPAQPRAYNYVCVDQQPEALHGLQANHNGALFYFQQGSCQSLGRCPPYKEGAELACVVCSK